MKAARLVAREMGCTVDELLERMSADEFQGHAEDLGYGFEEEKTQDNEIGPDEFFAMFKKA